MDIYEDRTDWQMNDHVDYNSEPLEWPENVFHEELGAQDDEDKDDDDTAAVPGLDDDDDDEVGDEEDEVEGDDDQAA